MPAPEAYFETQILPTSSCIVSNENVDPLSFELKSIFPNPASAITCIPVNSAHSVDAEITLFDIHGRLIKVIYNGAIPAGDSKYFFNAADFHSGIYTIQLATQSGIHNQKIVVR